ncbi:hypothetical protein PR048_014688 [Dryococelus australis]|uniref:Uncharacterized protein n=1 Tax=Dryococelus australis TaxID=614101 RepID=A0ABQ9HEX2_9NEOP|nr:hypothetical protein PR048_014688 [Dryococelus australis]
MGKVRCEAESLLIKLSSTDIAFMTSVCGCIMQQVGNSMKNLQGEDVDISTAVELYDSLTMFLTEFQTSFLIYKDLVERKLSQIRNSESVPSSPAIEIKKSKRQIKRKRFFDEFSESEEEPESHEKETGPDCEHNLIIPFLSNITELEALQIYNSAEKLRAIYNFGIEGNFGE